MASRPPAKNCTQLLRTRPELKEPGETGNDEQKVGDDAEQNRQRVWPAHMAGAQQGPTLYRPGLDEMGDEEAEAVPDCGDDDSGAESPRTISSCEDDDCYIDQRLKQVEKAELRNQDR
jgi:hypothetical protein